MTEAARAWFILQWYGVDVRALDGGGTALSKQPQFMSEQATRRIAPVSFRRPASHLPTVGLIDRQGLRESLEQGVQVLDARTTASTVERTSGPTRVEGIYRERNGLLTPNC